MLDLVKLGRLIGPMMDEAMGLYTNSPPIIETLAEKVEGIGIRDLPAIEIRVPPRGQNHVDLYGPPTVVVEGMVYPTAQYLAALLFADIHEVRYEVVKGVDMRLPGGKMLKKKINITNSTLSDVYAQLAGLQMTSHTLDSVTLNDAWLDMGGGPNNG